MIQDAATFRTRDGLALVRYDWGPGVDARAIVVVVHGFGEHGRRYADIAGLLAASNIATWTYDQRGHGRSPGQRGYVGSWSEYRDDLSAFVESTRLAAPHTPIFLLGHSMGALTVLDQAARDSLGARGVIASGTPVRPGEVAGPVRIALAKAMSRIWPRFTLSLPIEPEAVSSDPKVSRAYRDDPLVHGRATARWGTESLATIDRVLASAGEIHVPLLLIHGEDDELALVDGAHELAGLLAPAGQAAGHAASTPPGPTNVTLRTYPGARHEPHNDLSGEQVATDIAAWIERQLADPRDAMSRLDRPQEE